MNLELYPKGEEYCSNTVTAIKIPIGMEDEKLRNHVPQKYGVMIAGNWGELKGKVIRFSYAREAARRGQLEGMQRSVPALTERLEEEKGEEAVVKEEKKKSQSYVRPRRGVRQGLGAG